MSSRDSFDEPHKTTKGQPPTEREEAETQSKGEQTMIKPNMKGDLSKDSIITVYQLIQRLAQFGPHQRVLLYTDRASLDKDIEGCSDMGIPGLAYEEADRRDWETVCFSAA